MRWFKSDAEREVADRLVDNLETAQEELNAYGPEGEDETYHRLNDRVWDLRETVPWWRR